MQTEASDFSLDVRFDRELAWWRGDSCRYLVIEITARDVDDDAKRPPHHLTIAIDASSSMAGLAFAAAQRLAKGLVDRLGDSDTLAIVSFADQPRTDLPSTTADDGGKAKARAAIDAIELRSGSDFTEGWLAAAEQVAEQKVRDPDGFAVVIIISDGRADRGLRRTEELAQHGAELRARGISTATVAVGVECDLSLLLAVDPDGFHGQFAVAVGEEAVDTLVANRLQLLTEIAEEVQVSVTCPPLARITVLGTIPSERSGNRLVCPLANMRASSRRAVVLKGILPAAEVGETADFGIELSWTDMSGEPRQLGPVTRTQTFVKGRDNTPQKRDSHATMVVLMQWRLKLLRDIIALNRQGRLREAEAYLAREMKFFERYAHGIPEAAPLLTELRLALPAVHRPWREKASAPLLRRPRTVPGG